MAESNGVQENGVSSKPAVLIVGGLGYIGRWLALYIHENNLASEVRLVDKVLPQLAFLAEDFKDACSADKFMQADAGREQSLERIFAPAHAAQYDYVFNCGGETRHSQDDSVYALRSTALTLTLARECARRRTPAFVEFSTGKVYKPPSSSQIAAGGCSETAPLKPWLKLARHKLTAEEGLEQIRREVTEKGTGELRYAVLRLPHVYGDYDVGFLARGLCLARVYQSKGEEMKWLYGRDLRVNTLHVLDCASAAWKAAGWAAGLTEEPKLDGSNHKEGGGVGAEKGDAAPVNGARAFNLADDGDTSQDTIAHIIATLFNIPTGFQNALVSTFAKLNLDSIIDEVNDDVLQPWADLVAEKGIEKPGPISPFMERELLKDCNLCLDSARARKVLDWAPGAGREKLGVDAVGKVVESFKRMGWWP